MVIWAREIREIEGVAVLASKTVVVIAAVRVAVSAEGTHEFRLRRAIIKPFTTFEAHLRCGVWGEDGGDVRIRSCTATRTGARRGRLGNAAVPHPPRIVSRALADDVRLHGNRPCRTVQFKTGDDQSVAVQCTGTR